MRAPLRVLEVGAMAVFPESAWTLIVVVAGATGVAYYAYSSHRIGSAFGVASVPYGAVYAALFVTAFAPGLASVDRPAALLMSLVAWGLYTSTVVRSKAARALRPLKAVAVGVGFLALVVFPLFSVPVLEFLLQVCYRGAAVGGWVVGARPGLGRKGAKK